MRPLSLRLGCCGSFQIHRNPASGIRNRFASLVLSLGLSPLGLSSMMDAFIWALFPNAGPLVAAFSPWKDMWKPWGSQRRPRMGWCLFTHLGLLRSLSGFSAPVTSETASLGWSPFMPPPSVSGQAWPPKRQQDGQSYVAVWEESVRLCTGVYCRQSGYGRLGEREQAVSQGRVGPGSGRKLFRDNHLLLGGPWDNLTRQKYAWNRALALLLVWVRQSRAT